MAILKILEFPDPRLRNVAKPVTDVDETIKRLIVDMFDTMKDAQGIGLAASQIDVHLRVIVMDLGEDGTGPRVFINPEIEALDDSVDPYEEGCLSVPGFYEKVDRPAHVMIRALDGEGKAFEEEARGLLAVCIQHEIDHLEGKLFVDYLSPFKRHRIRKKLEKIHRQNA
ncbi:peptide deformylase [SAR92 clade bacterium H455]|uniref:Peptide deformylase n=1 Tax=SAR92 clade bacterium H455 TaxID=2974818 RepID=A0ABY5TNB0_9GAMM|nr:peptide deformylase [SAR92 clade bacterium H455]